MKLDRWREKKNWSEKKKKLDSCGEERLVRPLGLNTANLHTSIFDALKRMMVIIFSLVATFCGFRPWCQQDRTMRRFKFQSMTIFRNGAASQYSKVLLEHYN